MSGKEELSLKKAAIIGGTGYGALELIRLIQNHEHIELTKIISHSQAGEQITSIYPHLSGFIVSPMEALDIEKLKTEMDIIFFATPAGVSKDLVEQLDGSDVQCIDLSGDLRLSTREEYTKWYHKVAAPQEILDKAVYGLPEINREKIKDAKLVSNPGCFPTSATLGLIPLVNNSVIDTESIVIDGKTGVSGAGGKQSAMTHFSETNENVKLYKVGQHQHIPEIEQYLSELTNESVTTTFTTHLVPMTRGIICTIYGKLKKYMTTEEAVEMYKQYYESHPFVRIREAGVIPTTKEVHGSNFCDIGIYVDERTNQIIIASVIDNLVKGASGQAIQNANIMNSWEEDHGLTQVPIYP